MVKDIVVALIGAAGGIIVAVRGAGFIEPAPAPEPSRVFWEPGSAGDSCQTVCGNAGATPIQSASLAATGNPFFVCSGGGDNRPGYNIKDNGFLCGIGSGGTEHQIPSFSCLCKNF